MDEEDKPIAVAEADHSRTAMETECAALREVAADLTAQLRYCPEENSFCAAIVNKIKDTGSFISRIFGSLKMKDAESSASQESHSARKDMIEECAAVFELAREITDKMRCERLAKFHLLDKPLPAPLIEELLELVATLSKYEGALLTFIDDEKAYVKYGVGLAKTGEKPRNKSLCNIAIEKAEDVLVIQDVKNDARFASVLDPEEGISTYAGKAILSPDGVPLGAICLINSTVKPIEESEIIALQKASNIITQILARADQS